MRERFFRAAGAVCTLLSLAGPPAAQTAAAQTRYSTSGTRLLISDGTSETSVELGCEGTQVLPVDTHVIVACGDDGVAWVDLDDGRPRVSRLVTDGRVSGIRSVDGMVVATVNGADIELGRARLAATQPSAPIAADPAAAAMEAAPPRALAVPARAPSTAAPPPTTTPPIDPEDRSRTSHAPLPPVGRVTRARGGEALVTLDEWHTLRPGYQVELLRPRREPELALAGERADFDVVARAEVLAVEGTHARVRVEMDGNAERGLLVRQYATHPGISLMPPNVTGVTEVSLRARGFVPMGILGVGTLTAASIRHTTDFGLVVGAETMPLGLGGSNVGSVEAILAYGYLGLSLRAFEIGVGAGWSSANAPSDGGQQSGGFSVMQHLRFGHVDGLMLSVKTTLTVWEEEWIFGDLYAEGQAPLTHGIWLIAGGGGGTSGVRLAEAGVRILVVGTGLSGSVFVTATAGFGMLDRGRRDGETDPYFANGGPMAGVGLDWRI